MNFVLVMGHLHMVLNQGCFLWLMGFTTGDAESLELRGFRSCSTVGVKNRPAKNIAKSAKQAEQHR